MLRRLNDLRIEQAAKDEDGRVRCGRAHGERFLECGRREPVNIGRSILGAHTQAVAVGVGLHDLHDLTRWTDERAQALQVALELVEVDLRAGPIGILMHKAGSFLGTSGLPRQDGADGLHDGHELMRLQALGVDDDLILIEEGIDARLAADERQT